MSTKNHILYNTFSAWRFTVSKAEGSYIWDQNSKRLIDFTSGWNVTNLGWNNQEVAEAVIEQTKKNVYTPLWCSDPIQETYAKALVESLPAGLTSIGRATGGTEANEEALKTARAFTKRSKIIGFTGSYHGQSFATLAIDKSSDTAVIKAISPMPPDFIHLEYPRINGREDNQAEILEEFAKRLDEALKGEDVAAVITEAGIVTGGGLTSIAPDGYLKLVRDLTAKYGTLMILDEVGTGFSRCGKLFGLELENVAPDIITFAKGMSNGACAIGAMVTTAEIAEETYDKTNLTSTFGWTPIACAASLKVLEIHKREKLWGKSQTDGDYMIEKISSGLKDCPIFECVCGLGLEIGLTLKSDNASAIVDQCLENGLHLTYDMDNHLQIMPPLTIERETLDEGLDILISTIKEI